MAHGDAREAKRRGNWRMEWVASTVHTTSEHGVFSITTADAHTSAASSRLYWRPCRFKWTRPFRRKTKSGFCACAITFQTQSTTFSVIKKKAFFHSTLNFVLLTQNTRAVLCEVQTEVLNTIQIYKYFSFALFQYGVNSLPTCLICRLPTLLG
jgi:hypothetical protein